MITTRVANCFLFRFFPYTFFEQFSSSRWRRQVACRWCGLEICHPMPQHFFSSPYSLHFFASRFRFSLKSREFLQKTIAATLYIMFNVHMYVQCCIMHMFKFRQNTVNIYIRRRRYIPYRIWCTNQKKKRKQTWVIKCTETCK
jgi:hypothetical protein